MKKSAVLFVAVILLIFGGCADLYISEESTTAQSFDINTTVAVIVPAVSDMSVSETVNTQYFEESTVEQQTISAQESTTQLPFEESATVTEETTADFVIEEHTTGDENSILHETSAMGEITSSGEIASSGESITAEQSVSEESSTVQVTSAVEENSEASDAATAEEKTTVQPSSDEIELSISMPEKNGTMVTDKNSENEFIRTVNKEKGIAAELLLAVYSVPESGQNYVFEFFDENDFSAENIRRVYLIDVSGNITSVAATESSERENISAVENWFCMNVLIKEIIYPAVSGDVQ